MLQEFWESLKEWASNAWNAIKSFFSIVWGTIVSIFDALVEFIDEILDEDGTVVTVDTANPTPVVRQLLEILKDAGISAKSIADYRNSSSNTSAISIGINKNGTIKKVIEGEGEVTGNNKFDEDLKKNGTVILTK